MPIPLIAPAAGWFMRTIGWKGLAFIVAGLVVVGVIITIRWQAGTIADLERDLAAQGAALRQAIDVNKDNMKAMQLLEAAKQRSEEALRKQAEENRRLARAVEKAEQEIDNAPASEKGPVPRVIERAVEWMPEH
jgi:hypothetical protein